MNVDWQNVDNDRLMLWIMHAFADRFKHHAVLKGGMQLMLMSSARATNDLDYVFVPYTSKTEIVPRIEDLLKAIPAARIDKSLHSSSGRFRIAVGRADVQIEFNVSPETPSVELTTELLAHRLNARPRIIRVMSPDVALAHKLAAWNERRLLRDLYDAYYWYTHVGARPEAQTLAKRLSDIKSRLPALKKTRNMTMSTFSVELSKAIGELTESALQRELTPVLSAERLKGLLPVLKAQLSELVAVVKRLDAPA